MHAACRTLPAAREDPGARDLHTPGMAKVAILTGSDSGIGKAAAVALARDGFDIGITWHEDEAGARATCSEVRSHGRRTEIRHLDLASCRTPPTQSTSWPTPWDVSTCLSTTLRRAVAIHFSISRSTTGAKRLRSIWMARFSAHNALRGA